MSEKIGQMKENSTLNWRSTSTKISIKMFYAEVLTKDELGYEPERPLTRILKNLTTRPQLYETVSFISPSWILVPEGKVKHLRQQGKGKRPNAASDKRRRSNTLDGKSR